MDPETRLNQIWDRQIEISNLPPTEQLLHELAQLSIEENQLERALLARYRHD